MSDSVAIDNVPAPGGGRIGLTHCPGTGAGGLFPGDRPALLERDLARFREWGATGLVTLLEPHEMTLLGVASLGERAVTHGLQWWHLPITDGCAPGGAFETAWRDVAPRLHAMLDADDRVVVHCRAGLGRSGTIAARLLVERGIEPDRAAAMVRRVRPGAIEDFEQMAWVRSLRAR